MSIDSLYYLTPELTLVATATLIIVVGAFVNARSLWACVAVGGVVLAAVFLQGEYRSLFWSQDAAISPVFAVAMPGPLAADLFSQYVRWLALLSGLLFVLMSSRLASDVQVPEYLGSLLFAVSGLMLVASARELVLLFLGLELISIPTYVLLFLGRRDVASREATAKYFYLSILSSAIMLYGFSFLYGAVGSTQLTDIRQTLSATDVPEATLWFARLALVLIFAGLCFKITVVPFHFYAPDVYQGTTNGNAALLSVLPKVAGVVAIVRIVAVSMSSMNTYAWRIALVVALLTMTIGNVVALWQNNVRRLLAYSSIAHGGYMMIGLAVAFAAESGAEVTLGIDGVGATMLYVAVYVLATIGAFAVLVYLERADRSINLVDDLTGAARNHPWAGAAMAIFMFSLTGIPPLAGFWGKLNLFAGALGVRGHGESAGTIRAWFLALAIIGALNAAISAGYYLRIVAVMYFRPNLPSRPPRGAFGAGVAMLVCAILVLIAGVAPNVLQVGANSASQSARLPGDAPAVVMQER